MHAPSASHCLPWLGYGSMISPTGVACMCSTAIHVPPGVLGAIRKTENRRGGGGRALAIRTPLRPRSACPSPRAPSQKNTPLCVTGAGGAGLWSPQTQTTKPGQQSSESLELTSAKRFAGESSRRYFAWRFFSFHEMCNMFQIRSTERNFPHSALSAPSVTPALFDRVEVVWRAVIRCRLTDAVNGQQHRSMQLPVPQAGTRRRASTSNTQIRTGPPPPALFQHD
jgi:hypothetical protein